uniref:Uncharacterized protein n=1 Tax=Micrurus lemniscatus lemniscatus TaxID=129467 RepID=A0A2D4JLB1_MICLE
MSQSNYGAILGASSSPLPQSSNFSNLHQHERMNYQMHSGEVNGGLPSVPGFSSASTQYGVSSHTPPIGGTENVMGKLFGLFSPEPWKHALVAFLFLCFFSL